MHIYIQQTCCSYFFICIIHIQCDFYMHINIACINYSHYYALLDILDKVRDKTNLPRHESKHE